MCRWRHRVLAPTAATVSSAPGAAKHMYHSTYERRRTSQRAQQCAAQPPKAATVSSAPGAALHMHHSTYECWHAAVCCGAAHGGHGQQCPRRCHTYVPQ